MNKKKIGIIGYGKWCKKILPIIDKYFRICFIANSKINYKILCLDVDWVFVFTNNETHYKIVKFLLNKKKNVFCEKPLAENLSKCKKLFKLAKKNKVKLYVDDVEYYKFKKIKLNPLNKVIRTKNDKTHFGNLIFRLAYHDFYILSQYLKDIRISKIKLLKKNKKILNFRFLIEKKLFNFLYKTNSKNKSHIINKTNFLVFKKNPLELMFKNVFYGKANFDRNKKFTLFASSIIEKLNKFGIN